jgi:hypothetical protein
VIVKVEVQWEQPKRIPQLRVDGNVLADDVERRIGLAEELSLVLSEERRMFLPRRRRRAPDRTWIGPRDMATRGQSLIEKLSSVGSRNALSGGVTMH